MHFIPLQIRLNRSLNVKGLIIFKLGFASVNKTALLLSHFQFDQRFYLNTTCRVQFQESIRRRPEKHLFS